jgi:hypothetical protein
VRSLEYELDKLKRIIQNKDEEVEVEKKRFHLKWEKKCEEIDRERLEWNELY